MSTFGDLERAFADLYPYRWAFAAGFIAFMALAAGYAYPKAGTASSGVTGSRRGSSPRRR